MQFHSAIATGAEPEAACRMAAQSVQQALGPGPIDLAMVFVSPRYGAMVDRVPVLLHDLLGPRTLVGCSGAALASGPQRLENRHALVVLAGRLPGVQVDATLLTNGDLPDPDAPPSAWRALLPPSDRPCRGQMVLCEPFHVDARALLAGLDYGFPNVTRVGGFASGSRHPDGHTLFVGRQTHRVGALVVSFAGDIALDAVVAQGCRPIGRPGRVTKADRNRLLAVDDRPARAFVEEQLSSLSLADRELVEQSPLFLGIASDPFAATEPTAGDYLIRSILGVDGNGDLVVAEHLRIGRHVQLHLRCDASSQADLRQQLQRARPSDARAAVMFRCLGRDGRDHAEFAEHAPGVPFAGLHCNGEIGTLGDGTHLHAYSAVFALLRQRPKASDPR